MGFFDEEDESPIKEAKGFEYNFGDSAANTLQRWSKLLLNLQKRVEVLEEENKKLREVK